MSARRLDDELGFLLASSDLGSTLGFLLGILRLGYESASSLASSLAIKSASRLGYELGSRLGTTSASRLGSELASTLGLPLEMSARRLAVCCRM
jgi:hypothetical protein